VNFHFNNFDDFVAMGGHGFYVWLAYALVLFGMVFYFVYSGSQNKKKQQELIKFYRRLESRASSKNNPDKRDE
jgi:heme exporter protein D